MYQSAFRNITAGAFSVVVAVAAAADALAVGVICSMVMPFALLGTLLLFPVLGHRCEPAREKRLR